MDFITIALIALALAMDAFAVSVTSGITIRQIRIQHAATIALFFGLFQALMPIIGWLSGITLRNLISNVDHWVAFALLCGIGSKMIYESFKLQPEKERTNPLDISVLFVLAIATSIDALAVGISISLLDVSIILPALFIGVVTFSLCFVGVYVGKHLGHFFEKKIEILGGLILIGIGIRILVEHL